MFITLCFVEMNLKTCSEADATDQGSKPMQWCCALEVLIQMLSSTSVSSSIISTIVVDVDIVIINISTIFRLGFVHNMVIINRPHRFHCRLVRDDFRLSLSVIKSSFKKALFFIDICYRRFVILINITIFVTTFTYIFFCCGVQMIESSGLLLACIILQPIIYFSFSGFFQLFV